MIFRWGNTLVRQVVTGVFAGTLADYITRQFTLNANVIAVVWVLLYSASLVAYRFLSPSHTETSLLQNLTSRTQNYACQRNYLGRTFRIYFEIPSKRFHLRPQQLHRIRNRADWNSGVLCQHTLACTSRS